MNQRNRTSNRLGIFIIILAVVVPLILGLGYVGLTVIYNDNYNVHTFIHYYPKGKMADEFPIIIEYRYNH